MFVKEKEKDRKRRVYVSVGRGDSFEADSLLSVLCSGAEDCGPCAPHGPSRIEGWRIERVRDE